MTTVSGKPLLSNLNFHPKASIYIERLTKTGFCLEFAHLLASVLLTETLLFNVIIDFAALPFDKFCPFDLKQKQNRFFSLYTLKTDTDISVYIISESVELLFLSVKCPSLCHTGGQHSVINRWRSCLQQ